MRLAVVGGALASVAFCGAAVWGGCTGAPGTPRGTRGHVGHGAWGPQSLMPPPGAQVARSAADLRTMTEEPTGPREIWLEPRVYATELHIRRPLALRGAAGAVVEGGDQGTVIIVDADDVVIDNLTIRGSGRRHTVEDAGIRGHGKGIRVTHTFVDGNLFGISLQECHGCTIENSHVRGPDVDISMRGDGIKLWESHDSVVSGTLVERARDIVVWYSRRVRLEDNVVAGSRYGTHFMYAHDSSVRRSRVLDNVVGIFVMYSARLRAEDNVLAGARGPAGIGIGFKESDGIEVRGNAIVGNTAGIYLDRTPRSPLEPVVFERNVFALNEVAMRMHSSQTGISFRQNSIQDNGRLIEVEGSGDALGVQFSGNFWSDYAGYDLDGDGVGDVPFEFKRMSNDLVDTHPSLAFFRGTPAMVLLDTVAEAIPLVPARQLIVDPSPSMQPRAARMP